MKVIKLQSENVKRLSAIEVTPGEDNVIVVGGKNGQGKTSVIDSIAWALGGVGAADKLPVRKGQEKAEIVVDLGDIVVRRYFTETGGTGLTVKSHDGATYPSPQAMLDKLVGRLSFDPLAFSREQPKKQVEILKSLVGLDFTQIDADRKIAYDQRTEVGRELDRLKAKFANMPEHPDAPEEEVSVLDLMEELRKANDHNHMVGQAAGAAEQIADRVTEIEVRLEEQRNKVHSLRLQLKEAEETLADWESKREEWATRAKEALERAESQKPIDTVPLHDAIASAEETNRKVRDNKALAEARLEWQHAEELRVKFDKAVKGADETKEKLLAAAVFPVEGLSFDDTGVLYKGIPFDQCSAAEQLRVSLAMGMALNPKLRVMLVRDGSLLDDDSMGLIREMAVSEDMQVWIEVVTQDAGECTVLIEDGHVAAATSNGKAKGEKVSA